MDQDSITYKVLKNTSYNVIGFIIPMISSLIITPIVIFNLGIKEYGIIIFMNSLISLLGLLDLGFGTAMTKNISFYNGQKNFLSMKKLIGSANSFFLITSTLGLLISVIIYVLVINSHIPRFEEYQSYALLFLLSGSIFFINTVFLSYVAILHGLQRYDISNIIGLISGTLSSVTMLIIVLNGGEIFHIFIANLIINLVFSIITLIRAQIILPIASYKLDWNKSEVLKSFKFGLIFSANGLASSVTTSLSRIIIPFFVGPTNLTYYNMPNTITAKVPGISNTLSTTLFPMTSELNGANQKDILTRLYNRSIRLITIISASLTVTLISFSYTILLNWLDVAFAEKASSILIIMAIANFLLSIYNPLSNFLLGLGRLKFTVITSVIMSVMNILLLIILLPKYGITGAAVAYLISLMPIIYMIYITEKRFLSLLGRKQHYKKLLFEILTVSAMVFIINKLLLSHLITNLISALLICFTSSLIFIIIYKFLGFFENEDWDDIDRFYAIIKKRIINIFIK
jgi:O-antigen/teichoic acid export membrane protein